MKFIKGSKKELIQIREQHGVNYIRPYHELLAEKNGLHTTPIYKMLMPLQKQEGKYYVVAVIDDGGNCPQVGYTQSPFSYWITLLSLPNANSKIISVKEILILGEGLEKSEALAIVREKKKERVQIARNRKISKVLAVT